MVSAIYNIIRYNFFCSQLKNPVNKTLPDRDFYPCTLWLNSPLENEKEYRNKTDLDLVINSKTPVFGQFSSRNRGTVIAEDTTL